jgi:hypothetical protein
MSLTRHKKRCKPLTRAEAPPPTVPALFHHSGVARDVAVERVELGGSCALVGCETAKKNL